MREREDTSYNVKQFIGSESQRIVSLDLIRVIAITSVISMHINEATLSGVARCTAVEFGSLGVPLFAMLTGYLMLDRDYSSRECIMRFIKCNLVPLFIALEAWNIIWAIMGHVTGTPIPLTQTVRIALFLGDFGGGFWYLPMVFGLYLGIPLISRALKWLTSREVRPYTVIFGCVLVYFGVVIPTVVEICPIFGWPISIKASLEFGVFGVNDELGRSLWPLYLVAGYVVRRKCHTGGSKPVICSLILFSLSFIGLICMRSQAYAAGVNFNPSNYANALLLVSSISLIVFFVSIEDAASRLPSIVKRILQTVSESSFGVYMIHFTVLGRLLTDVPWLQNFGPASFFMLGGSVLLVSLVIVIFVSFIPVLNRYLLLRKPRRAIPRQFRG